MKSTPILNTLNVFASARCTQYFIVAATSLAAACNNYKTITSHCWYVTKQPHRFSFSFFFLSLTSLSASLSFSFVPFSARGDLIIRTFPRISLLLIQSCAHRHHVLVRSIYFFYFQQLVFPRSIRFLIPHKNICAHRADYNGRNGRTYKRFPLTSHTVSLTSTELYFQLERTLKRIRIIKM